MNEFVIRAREAEIRITGRRFCTTCQTLVRAADGVMLRNRWRCAKCTEARARTMAGREKEAV